MAAGADRRRVRGGHRRPDRRAQRHRAALLRGGAESLLPPLRGRRYLEGLRSLATAAVPLDVTAAPRWPELAATVTESTVGAELDRAEDELDAFLCAYVALLHAERGGRSTRVIGDPATGTIVVPVDAVTAACLDGEHAGPA